MADLASLKAHRPGVCRLNVPAVVLTVAERDDICAELARLRAQNEHLAGALERATTGQQDPVALRLGLPPVDTDDQPPPDLDEMRRLVTARKKHGCVAASVWLHDLEWILDALADSIPLRPQHPEELDQ